ncbi:hypothetical protein RSAG8_12395, partial [Rhizoctonia solani AG-8 WAC10335]
MLDESRSPLRSLKLEIFLKLGASPRVAFIDGNYATDLRVQLGRVTFSTPRWLWKRQGIARCSRVLVLCYQYARFGHTVLYHHRALLIWDQEWGVFQVPPSAAINRRWRSKACINGPRWVGLKLLFGDKNNRSGERPRSWVALNIPLRYNPRSDPSGCNCRRAGARTGAGGTITRGARRLGTQGRGWCQLAISKSRKLSQTEPRLVDRASDSCLILATTGRLFGYFIPSANLDFLEP